MAEAAMEAAEAAAAAAAAEAAMEASLGSAKDAVAVSRADLATLVEYARAARLARRPGQLARHQPWRRHALERRLSADAGAADGDGGPQLLSAADDLRTLMVSVAALRAEQRASKAEIGSLRRGWEHARLRRLAGALACLAR